MIRARCQAGHFGDPQPDVPLFPEGSVQAAAFIEAGAGLRARLDAEAHRGQRPGAPDWRILNLVALDEDNLPAVLAGVGLARRLDTLRAPDWWPDADGPVLLLELPDDAPPLALDVGCGAWRVLDPVNLRGADLIELAMARLRVSYGRAGRRLARLCGLADLPLVPAT